MITAEKLIQVLKILTKYNSKCEIDSVPESEFDHAVSIAGVAPEEIFDQFDKQILEDLGVFWYEDWYSWIVQ